LGVPDPNGGKLGTRESGPGSSATLMKHITFFVMQNNCDLQTYRIRAKVSVKVCKNSRARNTSRELGFIGLRLTKKSPLVAGCKTTRQVRRKPCRMWKNGTRQAQFTGP